MSFNARIKNKRDTASNWETNNPILLAGELIIVDTNAGDVRFKIGDGTKTYTQLPFQDESLYNVLSTKADSADLESLQASIVQSDLSQTDSTQIDYVKGVLRNEHLPEGYPYKSEETILDGTFEFVDSDGVYMRQIADENFTYVDGKSYTVIWDGEAYQCVATTVYNIPVLGNLGIAGMTDTGEPFLFMDQGNGQKIIGTNDTAATHTVTVCAEIAYPMSEEYLPDHTHSQYLTAIPSEYVTETELTAKGYLTAIPSEYVTETELTAKDYATKTEVAAKADSADLESLQSEFDDHTHDFSELTVTDPEAAKTALAIENGMVLKNLQAAMPSSKIWNTVAYGNGKFVAVTSSASSKIIAYSEDGVTWTSAGLPTSSKWNSITYGNGKFVALAYSSNLVVYSEDGITWNYATLPISDIRIAVAYGNGKFVTLERGGDAAAYSEDGIAWTATTLSIIKNWSSITYGNGKFVAISESATAAYSEDGITWTATTMPNNGNWKTVIYGNGKFVAVGSGETIAAYSEDGIAWAATNNMPIGQRWWSVAYGNGKFVATAESSDIAAYSEDGITWTATTMPGSKNWYSVAYGNGKFVAVSNDVAAYSEDGITWHSELKMITQNGEDVTADTLIVLDHTHDEYQRTLTITDDGAGNVVIS